MQTSAHSVWPQAQTGNGKKENRTLQRRSSHLQIKIIITCIYRPENIEHKLTKLQNKQTFQPDTQVSLSREMKEKAIKLPGKVVTMHSSPSGKRSENAGIHSFFLDYIHRFIKQGKTSAKGRISLVNCGELDQQVFPSENSV